MNTTRLSFGKDKTAIIKGIAIIMMVILHCGNPEWFDMSIPVFMNNSSLPHYFSPLKLCVGIYTFMVGYGYAFAKNKDWHYSWSHIKKLLIPFWTILFIFTFPILLIKKNFEGELFLLNLFGINSEYNYFSWFVAFFIFAMIVLPFMSRIINKRPIIGSVFLIILTYIFEAGIHTLPNWSENDYTLRLFDCFLCSPCMILGYLFSHQQWFVKIKIPRHWSMFFLSLILIFSVLLFRYHLEIIIGFILDFFYAPLFIIAVLIIFNIHNNSILSQILTSFGNVSVYMWFFHALFFTSIVRNVYQPFILISSHLYIIIPWTIILTYFCSLVISNVVKKIQEWIAQ